MQKVEGKHSGEAHGSQAVTAAQESVFSEKTFDSASSMIAKENLVSSGEKVDENCGFPCGQKRYKVINDECRWFLHFYSPVARNRRRRLT